MILLTVGSMFPFDRLIRSVDDMVGAGVIVDPMYAQIGDGSYEPKHIPFARFVSKPDFEKLIESCSQIIAHAGAGTIAQALERGKPLLVLPRLKRYAEHVNDHQIATARKFEELGHILVASEASEIPARLAQLKTFVPKRRTVKAHELAARVGAYLHSLEAASGDRHPKARS